MLSCHLVFRTALLHTHSTNAHKGHARRTPRLSRPSGAAAAALWLEQAIRDPLLEHRLWVLAIVRAVALQRDARQDASVREHVRLHRDLATAQPRLWRAEGGRAPPRSWPDVAARARCTQAPRVSRAQRRANSRRARRPPESSTPRSAAMTYAAVPLLGPRPQQQRQQHSRLGTWAQQHRPRASEPIDHKSAVACQRTGAIGTSETHRLVARPSR